MTQSAIEKVREALDAGRSADMYLEGEEVSPMFDAALAALDEIEEQLTPQPVTPDMEELVTITMKELNIFYGYYRDTDVFFRRAEEVVKQAIHAAEQSGAERMRNECRLTALHWWDERFSSDKTTPIFALADIRLGISNTIRAIPTKE